MPIISLPILWLVSVFGILNLGSPFIFGILNLGSPFIKVPRIN